MKRGKGLPSFPGSRSVYATLIFVSLLEAISIAVQAVFLARSITFLFQGQPIRVVYGDIGLFFLFFLIRHGLSHSGQWIAERFAHRFGKKLRKELVESYFQLGHRFVQTNGTGRLVTLAIEGMDQIKKYIEIAIPRMIRTFIVPSVVVIYVFTLDKASAVILVATVPIIIVFMILLGMAAQKMADNQYDTYRVLTNHFIDTLKGLETLTYLGQSKNHEGKSARVSERYRKATMRTLRVAFLSSFALDFFTSLSIAFVAVGLGLRLVDGSIMLLPALTILILAPEYFLPIRQVGSDYHATLDGQIALEQVEQIIRQKQQDTKKFTQSPLDWNAESTISFKQITVTHDGDKKPILDNLSFKWKGMGSIGIVGQSGAGKSTFIDVLAGFLKQSSGKIEIDGEAANLFSCQDWLEKIAYIPQHPYIFPASLADNLKFYEPGATDAEVNKVIDEIGLRPFVEQLPGGMHEQIGEGGRALSGGQEQRIAIGRALLSKKPILLLDEPTAHLDIETEYELKQHMLKLFRNKLVFLATHRLHWMENMDLVLVLENGSLEGEGTHSSLLSGNESYRKLVDMYTRGGTPA